MNGKEKLKNTNIYKHFNAMLMEAKINDYAERGIVPYSLRHFMITQRILAGLSTLNLEEVSSRKAAAEHLKNFIPEAGTRQFLLKNLYWVSEGKLGLRINVAVLKNAAEAIGAAIQSQKQYHQPTLFLYGENSNYINPMTDTEILKYFPKAEIIEIKGAGHWLHAEKPLLFFKTLTQWLV